MIEPELVFADLNDDMRLAEDYVRYCCQVSSAVVSSITAEPQAS
jgi:aspartyl/asparaginyl-tRNA synthetase